MKRNKILKRVLLIIGGTAVAFVLVLLVHIVVMVKEMPEYAYRTTQLGRADFKEPVDSATALLIQQKIKKLPGVSSTYFNQKDDILVYAFDNSLNSSENIYNTGIKNSGIRSVRYIVSDEDLKNGCPAMNGNSFYGKLTQFVSNIVN